MVNGNTKSLKAVLWKVMNNPLAAELTYDLAAEYAIEGIRLIGAPLSLVNKVSNPPIRIEGNKGALPIDVIELRGIRGMVNKDDNDSKKFAMTIASDLYHNSQSCSNTNEGGTANSYTASNGVIQTGFKEGYIEVSYKALPTDEDNFPLIPDNQKVLLAIEYYILFRYLEPLWMVGKLTDKAFSYIDTKKCFYIASANTDMQIQSYDHVESIMNGINRIIINSNAHSNFFKGANKKERLKRY